VRVTLVVHQFPPRYFTGTESYALAIGRELQARGHDVDVFALDPAFGEATGPWGESREVVDGLPVRRIWFWMMLGRDWTRMEYRHPLMAAAFGEHLRQRGTDVVHVFHLRHLGADLIDEVRLQGRGLVVSLMDFWFLCPRVILMRADGSPCSGPPDGGRGCLPCHAPELAASASQHAASVEALAAAGALRGASQPSWEIVPRLVSLLDRAAYLRARLLMADAIVAPTEFLRAMFVQNGVPAGRIHCHDYGIDTTGIAAGAAAARSAARPLTFGFFGTFVEHKGPHLLVAAMAKVRGDCRVVLRGRATDFPEYAAPLLAAAARDPRIQVLPPFDRAGMPAAFGAIDVLVVPSTWHENAPFVVLEARAAGLPVIASDFGGLAEVVRDGIDGDRFRPGDVDQLAQCLRRLLEEPQRVRRYRAAVTPPKSIAAATTEFETHYRAALSARAAMVTS
jgi:glycosyltransferase involved in cell wall biosynthesis